MRKHGVFVISLFLAVQVAPPAHADPARDDILGGFATGAKGVDPAFAGFSVERGKTLFFAEHVGGKPKVPACTVCHTEDPRSTGETRAGKPIDPIAVSKTPARFTDPKKVAKWFRRNCNTVLGRECTPVEKGDFITFMAGQ